MRRVFFVSCPLARARKLSWSDQCLGCRLSALNLQGRELCCTVCKSSATPDFSQQTLVHWRFTCWFLSSMSAYGDVLFTALA